MIIHPFTKKKSYQTKNVRLRLCVKCTIHLEYFKL